MHDIVQYFVLTVNGEQSASFNTDGNRALFLSRPCNKGKSGKGRDEENNWLRGVAHGRFHQAGHTLRAVDIVDLEVDFLFGQWGKTNSPKAIDDYFFS